MKTLNSLLLAGLVAAALTACSTCPCPCPCTGKKPASTAMKASIEKAPFGRAPDGTSPSCPNELSPQHHNSSSFFSTQVCNAPTASNFTPVPTASTRTGA